MVEKRSILIFQFLAFLVELFIFTCQIFVFRVQNGNFLFKILILKSKEVDIQPQIICLSNQLYFGLELFPDKSILAYDILHILAYRLSLFFSLI